jgi:diguanylate cyclase (GGDEF)-like protein/PAS domain S-box-containing protein
MRDVSTVQYRAHMSVAGALRTRSSAFAVVLVVAGCVAHFLRPSGWQGHTSYLAVTVGAAGCAWLGFRRLGGAVRLWLAVGISASALGDTVFQGYVALNGVSPDISIADGPWIASYVGTGLAMLVLLRSGFGRGRSDIDGLIDAAVIVIGASLVLWVFWLNSTFTDGSVPIFVRGVWAAYPILDATLLALVIRTLLERRSRTGPGLVLAAGVLCWLAADFSFMLLLPDGTFGALLDIGWMVGAALLAAGCWLDFDLRTAVEPRVATGAGRPRIMLSMLPLLIPSGIEVVAFSQGEVANPWPLLAATVAFAGFAAARALHQQRLRADAQTELANSEKLHRAVAMHASDAVLVLDAAGCITNDAPSLATLVGHPGQTTVGYRALDFIPDTEIETHHLLDNVVLSSGVVLSGETQARHRDGRPLWLSLRAVNLLHDPAVNGIIVNVHDITDRKLAEEQLVHQAFHDSLTGLANRALFRDRVKHALDRRGRSGLQPAVIYLDLDGFKNVNDGLGHDPGDQLLVEVAERLQSVVRAGDTVARLGGDEFAILVEESALVEIEAEAIADRALHAMTIPLHLDGHQVTLSASIGIAYASEAATEGSLLRDADVAMYQAKANGKARWVVFQPAMRASAVERLRLGTDLADAVDHHQLRLMYQPVVELESNRIVGFEALLRWQHPELGLIMPDRFIPIAEETGVIVPIGAWVLQQACLTAANWRRRHPGNLTMAVNLSAKQLAAPELYNQVCEALHTASLDPAALVLEMTETALVQDPTAAAAKLHELRSLGVRLAIDDFGTGYSSLSYLRQFPVDILKIDRSFINTITDRDNVPAIVRGLLDLGRTLQLETIAEGIESDEQRDQLVRQHCELGQGFLFARPLPADEAELLLDSLPAPIR